MKKIHIICSIMIPCLLITAFNSSADRIEHFWYETCYAPVPLRESPSPNARKIIDIPKGVKVQVSDQKGYWVKAIYRDADDNYFVGWAASTAMCPTK